MTILVIEAYLPAGGGCGGMINFSVTHFALDTTCEI